MRDVHLEIFEFDTTLLILERCPRSDSFKEVRSFLFASPTDLRLVFYMLVSMKSVAFANESKEHWLCKVARFVAFFAGISLTYLLKRTGAVKISSSFLRASLGFHLIFLIRVVVSVRCPRFRAGLGLRSVAFGVIGAGLVLTTIRGKSLDEAEDALKILCVYVCVCVFDNNRWW